jgi:PAS domain S-box-containing protein
VIVEIAMTEPMSAQPPLNKSRLQHEALRTILDNMPVMVSVFDASGRLTLANAEWERVLGWTVREAQQLNVLAELYPDPSVYHAALDFIRRAERRWQDFVVRTRDGRSIDVSWARFRLSDGSRIGFGVEITDRKRAEAERVQLLESERLARASAERTLERLRAIQSITDSALMHLSTEQLLQELLTRLRVALDIDFGSVLLLDNADQQLCLRASSGVEIGTALRVPVGKGVSGRIVAEGRPVIIDDLSTIDISGIEGMPPSAEAAMARMSSAMGVPLRVGAETIGAVFVSSRKARHFVDEDLQLLLLVADRVAPAIERSRLLEAVRSSREALENLSRRLLAAQEEERRRLAIELHDELGQVLTAIKINLESKCHVAAVAAHLVDTLHLVEHAMDRVRMLALALRPSVLDDLGLAAALRWHVDQFARESGVETHLCIDSLGKLDPALEITCFRIAQESLTNIARHAAATRVRFNLRATGDGIELHIHDNGVGFDTVCIRARAINGASLGILGMEERATLVGGRLIISSEPGMGTDVYAWFPREPRQVMA